MSRTRVEKIVSRLARESAADKQRFEGLHQAAMLPTEKAYFLERIREADSKLKRRDEIFGNR
jgi:hypothetical protein